LAVLQTVANLGIPNLTHAPTERIPYQESLIDDSLALKVFVPSECDSFVCALFGIDSWRQMSGAFPCGPNNSIRLISEIRRKPTMNR
jgi:hypothetical protein